MKKVIRFQTSDGKLHASFEEAKKHADNRYGDALTKLSHRLVKDQQDNNTLNYFKVTEFVDKNLFSFVQLQALANDLHLDHDDDDDDEDEV